MRLEEILNNLCRAARMAVERKGELIEIPGFPGYALELIEISEEQVLGLHTPPKPGRPNGSFDVGLGMEIARMCGLDYQIHGTCTIDSGTMKHLIGLYKKGWHARIWKPEDPECWAEIVSEEYQEDE